VGSKARRRRLEEAPAPEAYVPRLRIVGTTWRERGSAYRWRRFWYAGFLLLVWAVLAALAVAGLINVWDASHPGFWVLLSTSVIVVLVTGALEWRSSARRLRSDYSAGSYRLVVPIVVVVGLGWLFLPHGGAVVLALAGVLAAGPIGAQLVRACFDRELWPEREWRMSGLSPAERRRAEHEKGWVPARFRTLDHPKPDSEVHPHE
jgi:hypothetical protein